MNRESIRVIEQCPDCDNKLVELVNETYCPKCGLVVDINPVDFGFDWDTDENSRAGKPARYIDGDTTKLGPTDI